MLHSIYKPEKGNRMRDVYIFISNNKVAWRGDDAAQASEVARQ